jgi:serine/threonine-protein kinase
MSGYSLERTKIRPEHLSRAAFIYVRQSSPKQVRENLESQRRQYGFAEQAVALGWSEQQLVIVDEDQARSGAIPWARSGFARLVGAVARAEVGIVLSLELSRLSRNDPDWHHLVHLCRWTTTLIADEQGPRPRLGARPPRLANRAASASTLERVVPFRRTRGAMPLSLGTRLGPYEVLGLIGAGGMGEVYRARDTRLDRTVALKVLPAELAAEPTLRARFEREAHAISALEHPHICTLHDVGETGGRAYLVLEHLSGETLAERLRKGALPLPRALEVATQIAEALAAAHRQGIVHRDLKPGNVMLTKTGVKLLDFGLARLTRHGERPVLEELTSEPTASAPLTGRGAILGTAPYMAPEQLAGKPADARSDLWALGAIVYEMVAGRRAFEGSSPVSLMAAIVEREPVSLSKLQPATPPALDRLVRRCLAKSPDDRWDTAHDLAEELRWVAQTVQAGEVAPARRAPARTIVGLAALALAAGFLAALATGWRLTGRAPRPVVHSLLDVRPAEALLGPSPHERWYRRPSRTAFALSPDGRTLAFAAQQGERQQLYLRRLEQPEATAVPGTEGAEGPFFSPDGAWVGYWAQGALRRVSSGGGGPPVELCRLPGSVYGASWSTDDRIVFGQGSGGLRHVPASGGAPEPLTALAPGEAWHVLPYMLPGGKAVLFTALDSPYNWRSARVVAQALPSGARKVLAEDAADARYVPTGHVVFARRGNLLGFAFDPRRLARTSGEVGLVTGVMQALNAPSSTIETGGAQFSVSASGALAYLVGGVMPTAARRLVSVDRSGRVQPLPGDEHRFLGLQLSPDGRRLALYAKEELTTTVYTYDLARGVLTRLMPEARGAALFPRWAPDGTRIAIGWSGEGRNGLFLADADGRRPPQALVESDVVPLPASWTPDGRGIVFVRGGDVLVHWLDGEKGSSRPLLDTPAVEQWPELSPDGKWLAYASDETGRSEVYVRRFPDLGGRVQVSADGGVSPLWSRDGRRLFYVERANESVQGVLTELTVSPGPSLVPGPPRPLFDLDERRLVASYTATGYTQTPDGQGFVFAQTASAEVPPPPSQIHLVQNWLDELKERVPAR